MTLHSSTLQQKLFANISVLMEKAQSKEKMLQGRVRKVKKRKAARSRPSASK
jgi:hypothetical protein